MKKFLCINIVLFILCIIADLAYIVNGTLFVKGLASSFFVIMGAVNLLYSIKAENPRIHFAVLTAIGLVFSMAGDILLNIDFITGAALFGIGHIFYFSAYCKLHRLRLRDIVVSLTLFAAAGLFINLAPIFVFENPILRYICTGYALVISFMLGKAISNFIGDRNGVNSILASGSVLFFFSDLMLSLDVFTKSSDITGFLCLITYYPAQCIIAYSILSGGYKK